MSGKTFLGADGRPMRHAVGGNRRCLRLGCNEDATVAPVVCVPAKGYPIATGGQYDPLRVVIGLPLCREHGEQAKAEDLIGNDPDIAKRVIDQTIGNGRAPPDWAGSFVDLIDITTENEEWESLLAGYRKSLQ